MGLNENLPIYDDVQDRTIVLIGGSRAGGHSFMRQSNVIVATRLREAVNSQGHLPSARANVQISEGHSLVVNAEESTDM